MGEPLVCSFQLADVIFAAVRPSGLLWGYIVPGLIFAIAFAVTWALYRRFAGRHPGD